MAVQQRQTQKSNSIDAFPTVTEAVFPYRPTCMVVAIILDAGQSEDGAVYIVALLNETAIQCNKRKVRTTTNA